MTQLPWDFTPELQSTDQHAIPNMPTDEGRALGVELARLTANEASRFHERHPSAPPMCDDCAFRAGTHPNGCPSTLMDAVKCVAEGVAFMCHREVQADGRLRVCTGFRIASQKGEA